MFTVLDDIPKMFPILKTHQENSITTTLVIDCPLEAKPGQFVNLWIPRLDEKPYSIAFADGKKLVVSIAAIGPFSKAASELKAGDSIGVRGPYGTSFTWGNKQTIAMVGGGYGAAPLYFAAVEAIKNHCEVDLILGARREDLLMYQEKIRALDGAQLYLATDDGSVGHHGYNTQVLEKLLKEKTYDTILTVGPELMMYAVFQLAQIHKTHVQVSLERYMKCGFGLCGQCVVDPTGDRTCVTGPVVSGEYAQKVDEFGKYHRDSLGKKHLW